MYSCCLLRFQHDFVLFSSILRTHRYRLSFSARLTLSPFALRPHSCFHRWQADCCSNLAVLFRYMRLALGLKKHSATRVLYNHPLSFICSTQLYLIFILPFSIPLALSICMYYMLWRVTRGFHWHAIAEP